MARPGFSAAVTHKECPKCRYKMVRWGDFNRAPEVAMYDYSEPDPIATGPSWDTSANGAPNATVLKAAVGALAVGMISGLGESDSYDSWGDSLTPYESSRVSVGMVLLLLILMPLLFWLAKTFGMAGIWAFLAVIGGVLLTLIICLVREGAPPTPSNTVLFVVKKYRERKRRQLAALLRRQDWICANCFHYERAVPGDQGERVQH